MTIGSMKTESAAATFELVTDENGNSISVYPRGKEFYERSKDAKNAFFTLPLSAEETTFFSELLRGLANNADLTELGKTGTVGATGEQSFAVVSGDKNTTFLFSLHGEKIAVRVLVAGKLHAGGTYTREAAEAVASTV